MPNLQPSPDNITKLEENEIFVFGSNFGGRHGKGAALTALRKFGAVYGQSHGLMGRSYGIPTMSRNFKPLSISEIKEQVNIFIEVALFEYPNLKFLVTQIGCGLGGKKPKDIAPMFRDTPDNVYLPKSFLNILWKSQ